MGITSALTVFVLGVVYLIVTVSGLLARTSPNSPIPDPYFSAMEVLILIIAITMVVLMAVAHVWAAPASKTYSLLALLFMTLMACVTCCVHFVILSVSHQPAVRGATWLPFLLSFSWPSATYALDILAWDVLYGVSVLFAAAIFKGDRLSDWIRVLLVVSGVLAIGGVSGVIVGDMQLRLIIGVTGYGVLFPIVALLIARVFRRTEPASVEAA